MTSFHTAMLMIISQYNSSFFYSCVEVNVAALSFHMAAKRPLRANVMMYNTKNFLFIHLATNVSIFTVLLHLRMHINTTVKRNALEPTSEY